MNAPHRLQDFPPLSPESIGKAFRDGRAYRRFDGPPRHYRIGIEPPFPLWLKVYLVVAFVGSLAIWCVA